jgi:tetratricopeptide (TPR) repeat protein
LGPSVIRGFYAFGEQSVAFSFENSESWSFDGAVAACLIVAIALDCFTQQGSPFGRATFLACTQNQQTNNQSQVVSLEGNQGPVTFNYGSQVLPAGDLDAAITSPPSHQSAAREGGYHDQIEVAVSYLKEEKIEAAIEWLLRLRRRDWDKLSPRERFRVLANLGHCSTRRDDFAQALAYFKEAHENQPEDIEAQCLVAGAEFSAGNESVAQTLAQGIAAKHPNAVYARAVLLRTTPPDILAESLWEELPIEVRKSPTIVSALAWRGLRNEEYQFVRRLLAEPCDPAIAIESEVLTAVVTISELSKRIQSNPAPTDEELRKVEGAIAALEVAIAQMERLPGQQQCAQANYYLAKACELLKKPHSTDHAYKRAVALWPNARDIAREYVRFLVKCSRLDDAIAVLDHNSYHQDDAESQSLLAACLAERCEESDRARAIELLKRVVESICEVDSLIARNSLYTLCILLAESGDVDDVDLWLDKAKDQCFSDAHILSIKAAALVRAGKTSEAQEVCRKAIASLLPGETKTSLADVADACRVAGLFSDAVDTYIRYIGPDDPPSEFLPFLQCANKAERDDILLGFCQQLREKEIVIEPAIDLEAYTREKYDDDRGAVAALDSYLHRKDTGRFADLCRLRKAVLGLKYGRTELWQSVTSEQLPRVEDANGRIGGQVIAVLLEQGKRDVAVEYGYELIRRNPDDSLAHRAYVGAIGFPQVKAAIRTPDAATVSCAVEYEVIGTDERGWWIIEDGPKPNYDLRELAPEHPLATTLMGKKVGDEFVLRARSFQDVSAKVVQLMDKRLYRLRTTIEGWEDRFQDDPFVWKIDVPTTESGEVDPSQLLRALDRTAESAEQLKSLYLDNPLSVASFSVLSGTDPYTAAFQLAADTDLPIRCSLGNVSEYQDAVLTTSKSMRFVVCPSALATLWLIRGWETFTEVAFELVISKSTLLQLQWKQEKGMASCDAQIWKDGDQYVRAEMNREEQARSSQDFAEFVSWVTRVTTQVDGTALAALSADEQNNSTTIFGRECAQSIAIAKQTQVPLWTDDLGLAEFARIELGVPRTWTEVLLAHLRDNGSVSASEYAVYVARLNGFGYTHTRVTPEAICQAARESMWNPNHYLFASAARWLNLPGLDPLGVAQIASQVLPLIWKAAPLEVQAHTVTVALIKELASTEPGRAIAFAIQRHIEQLFGVDPLSGDRCRAAIAEGLSVRSHKRIFMPGDGGTSIP